MVPPQALIRQLQDAFVTLNALHFDVHDHKGQMFDVAFEIVTIETAIAGIADTLLSGGGIPREHLEILRSPALSKENRMRLQDGAEVDLSDHPVLLSHLRAIERLRSVCLRIADHEPGSGPAR